MAIHELDKTVRPWKPGTLESLFDREILSWICDLFLSLFKDNKSTYKFNQSSWPAETINCFILFANWAFLQFEIVEICPERSETIGEEPRFLLSGQWSINQWTEFSFDPGRFLPL